jgi:hypothetical protein
MFIQMELEQTNYKNITDTVREERKTVKFKTGIDMKNLAGIFSQFFSQLKNILQSFLK